MLKAGTTGSYGAKVDILFDSCKKSDRNLKKITINGL